ncbi:hypothetical protein ASPCADRAFT_4140 [Aspergillus carbonarius ITEM 5010]|uniref:FAD/NAD(P)-binding domain-containing protein n=1 Tax=Aspergillus carbonarius (strain ITEM 5010) TaxID=602072 RepID=A0A1R3RSQ5_ASPC5|nr:hypothetical protein ASPCADRAFT_4140 [Aspergillus carbonarius ITEM 5010]
MTDQTTIAIIGASFTGLPIAHGLLSHFHRSSSPPSNRIKLILINPSPFFYWAIAAPRILAKPSAFTESQYLLPIAEGFSAYSADEFEFVLGKATSWDPTTQTIIVESPSPSPSPSTDTTTRQIPYHYLVIASGSSTPATTPPTNETIYPVKALLTPSLPSAIHNAQSTISSAKSILIAGAGPIGIELAGELGDLIAQHHPTRELSVTLISATERLLPNLKPSAGKSAEDMLVSLGVRVIKGRRVVGATTSTKTNTNETPSTTIITLDNGDEMTADIYIPTTGVLPNNTFIPREFLNEAGWVKVTPELTVQGLEGVYAAGDITDHALKLALKVKEMVPVVVGNLIDDIMSASVGDVGAGGGKKNHCGGGGGGGSGSKRKTYVEGKDVSMVVPVGETGGTGQLFGWVPWSFLVRVVKGRDFFIGKAREVVFP